ncbi:MAG: SDR family oxidoreductase [Rhodospirillales bacterium]|nr:SDR family oxidoreductase [Rhodospirillales bacterium]
MDLGIKGKTALVLGASQGIGGAIAAALAAEGCNLVIGARNEEALQANASELSTKHGVEVTPYAIDMTDADAVEALCAKVKDDWTIDILVNNAGGPPPSPSTGVDAKVWQNTIQSLLLSVIRLSETAVEGMRERKWGRILTVASSGVIQPIPNLAVSNTVRSAVVGFSKSLSSEVAKDGVTVNMILPGRIDTARVEQIDAGASKRLGIPVEQVRENFKATVPAGRYGKPEEFASVAAFLASDLASYVTGHLMRVDGGSIRSV